MIDINLAINEIQPTDLKDIRKDPLGFLAAVCVKFGAIPEDVVGKLDDFGYTWNFLDKYFLGLVIGYMAYRLALYNNDTMLIVGQDGEVQNSLLLSIKDKLDSFSFRDQLEVEEIPNQLLVGTNRLDVIGAENTDKRMYDFVLMYCIDFELLTNVVASHTELMSPNTKTTIIVG